MDPLMLGAVAGGAQLLGGGLSFLGANSQSKAVRQAMERYISEVNRQRDLFLNQPESTAIRSKLQSYIGGDVGYSPETVEGMKKGVYEDYGKSLADMTRLTQKAGAGSTGVYTPGRADRTSRLLGQNIAANRATSIRDINQKNADVALNNQRFAISALPTYMPGTPATNIPGADVFLKAGETPSAGSYLGPALGQAANSVGNMALMGPVYERMMAGMMPYPNLGAYSSTLPDFMGAYSYGIPKGLFPTS